MVITISSGGIREKERQSFVVSHQKNRTFFGPACSVNIQIGPKCDIYCEMFNNSLLLFASNRD